MKFIAMDQRVLAPTFSFIEKNSTSVILIHKHYLIRYNLARLVDWHIRNSYTKLSYLS